MSIGRGDASREENSCAQALGLEGRAGTETEATGADGGILLSVQDRHNHIPARQSGTFREGRGNEGRYLHLPAAGLLFYATRVSESYTESFQSQRLIEIQYLQYIYLS